MLDLRTIASAAGQFLVERVLPPAAAVVDPAIVGEGQRDFAPEVVLEEQEAEQPVLAAKEYQESKRYKRGYSV